MTNDSTVETGPPTEFAAVSAEARAGGVEQFVADWESARGPLDLSEYLPDANAIRRAALIKLIKIDLEYRWLHSGKPRRLADYLGEFPELLSVPLDPELVYEEFRVRQLSGVPVDPDEYVNKFPEQADQFERLLEHDRREQSARISPASLESRGDLGVGGVGGVGQGFGVGQTVDEFELLMELGQGTFAQVFLARQRSMQRLVALKISRDVGTEPQTLAQLDHDNIVRVFDQRLFEDRQQRLLFMQYVPGGTLLDVLHRVRTTPEDRRNGHLLLESVDEVLERRGEIRAGGSSVRDEIAALTWPETIAWLGARLADALDYAGEHGVFHRDIKPANVLLTVEGLPKLADFNVSSSGNDVHTGHQVCCIGGSLAYMSPEQLQSCDPDTNLTPADLDTRSDIYALAVMLWELLTGRRPFDDEVSAGASPQTPPAMLKSRRRGVGQATLAALPTDCPAALRRILLKSLAPDPKDRWSTGAALARQFALCIDAQARDLVDPPMESWRARLSDWALPILILGIGIPNVLAVGYNYYYNKMLIISSLPLSAQEHLEQIHLILSAIGFPLGAALIIYWCRLALTVPRGLRQGRTFDAETLANARTATLLLGHRAVVVSFGLWVLAGIAYPIALQIVAGGIPLRAYSHLIASFVVCGAVALAYPFFTLTLYAVRSLYPVLLSHGELSSGDTGELRKLRGSSTRYLAVAASVPLVGVAGLSFVGTDPAGAVNATVRALCLGGIFAFIVVYRLFRAIEGDLQALERVVSGEFVTR